MKARHIWSVALLAAFAVVGCTSTDIDPYHRQGTVPGGSGGREGGEGGTTPTPTVTVKERSDWGITYKGRALFEAGDPTEEFEFKYTGSNFFIFRTMSDAYFQEHYNGSMQAFLEGEADDVVAIAEQNDRKFYEDTGNVFTSATKSVYFDLMVHGDYTGYLIEMDKDGKPTYNYAKKNFTVVEETATDAYTAWLGGWTVSNGLVGYNIKVSPLENNYLYRVDGWETGDAAGSVQMNQDDDWLVTRFADGDMVFFIQFIASYSDYEDLGDVDYMFVGTFTETTGTQVDYYENRELARAKKVDDKFVLEGGHAVYPVDGKTITPAYETMRYALYSYKNKEWVFFHDNTPTFPLTLVRNPDVKADIAPVTEKGASFERRFQPRARGSRTQGPNTLRRL